MTSDNLQFSVHTWDNYWSSLTIEEKQDVADFSSPWKPDPKIVYRGVFSKIRTLLNAFSNAYRVKKNNQIEDAYNYLLAIYGEEHDGDTVYEKLLLLILRCSVDYGSPLDHYSSLTTLGQFYRFDKNDIKNAIECYKQANDLMDSCSQEFITIEKPSKERFNIFFNRPALAYMDLLIEDGQLEESLVIEKDVISRGLFENKMDDIEYLKMKRVQKQIEIWKNDGQVPNGFEEYIKPFRQSFPAYAANYYKDIGNIFYKLGDFEKAKSCFENALSCFPELSGVSSKLKTIEKKLSSGRS